MTGLHLVLSLVILGGPIIVTVAGIIPLKIKDPATAIVWELVSRAIGLCLFEAMAVLVLPAFQKIFEDFGTDLPAATMMVLKLTGISRFDHIILFVFASAIFVGEVILFSFLRRSENGKTAAVLVSLSLTGGQVILYLFALGA